MGQRQLRSLIKEFTSSHQVAGHGRGIGMRERGEFVAYGVLEQVGLCPVRDRRARICGRLGRLRAPVGSLAVPLTC